MMTIFGKSTDWVSVQNAFKIPKTCFLEMLKIDRDFSGSLLQELKVYIGNEEFKPDLVTRKSAAAR